MRIFFVYDWKLWWTRAGGFPPDVLDREDAGSFAGGETHLLECAFAAVDAGYEVVFFSDLITAGDYRGIKFCPARDFVRAAIYAKHDPPDFIVSYLNSAPLTAPFERAVRLFAQQCNDLPGPDGWQQHCDGIIAASHSHADHLSRLRDRKRPDFATYSSPYYVVHNGCHFEKYPAEPVPPQSRNPLVAYWSSPDRGLHLLLDAWPEVTKAMPAARLRVHYEIERLLALKGNLRGIRVEVLQAAVDRAKRDPSISFTGMLSRPTLRRMQCETRVMCYPLAPCAGYVEGFGGSVAEACAAGVLPLISPVDAFPAVYRGAARFIEGDPSDRDFPKLLASQIVEALKWDGVSAPSMEALRERARRWSWTNSRSEFLDVLDMARARKLNLPVPEARSCPEQAD